MINFTITLDTGTRLELTTNQRSQIENIIFKVVLEKEYQKALPKRRVGKRIKWTDEEDSILLGYVSESRLRKHQMDYIHRSIPKHSRKAITVRFAGLKKGLIRN